MKNIKIISIFSVSVLIFTMVLFSGCVGCAKKKKSVRPKRQPKKVEKKVETITFTINAEGKGYIKFQNNKYQVDGIREFEIDIPVQTDVELSWKSSDNSLMSIKLTTEDRSDDFDKEWIKSSGSISLKSGDISTTECFIHTVEGIF